MRDLSILIPANKEEFLAKTVEDILKNKRGNTEIIVGVDGDWPVNPIEDHPDVRLVRYPKSIGQRAMTNQLCKMSTAKYIAKTDAHCAFDEGFDVKLMEAMQDDWTIAPNMKNLHVFNWVCKKCGFEEYQEGKGNCKKCGGEREKKIIWFAKPSPNSTSYRFDRSMHFQYWGKYKDRQVGDVVDTLSLQGSFFMLTREKYWKLNICDEAMGSWGQQGVEVAMKTWLSGGQVKVVRNTWYAHLFRTQAGFGFPYKQRPESEIKALREYTKDLFTNNKWPLAKRSFQSLLDQFYPVPDWEERKGIIFYTDNQLNTRIAHKVQDQLREVGLPITSVSLKPMPHFGKNIHLPLKRGIETYFKQIITALENCDAEIVFFCEHDVLYHPSHFDYYPTSKDKFCYNLNVWRLRYPEDYAVHWEANQVAELCCYKELALQWYREKLKEVQEGKFNRSYEPGGRDPEKYVTWTSKEPNIDIRHGSNLTKSKWSEKDFRDKSTCINWKVGKCPEWAKAKLLNTNGQQHL